MTYKKPKNLFECFERWHPLFNGLNMTLATIDDQFEPKEHRNATLAALAESAEEVEHDLTDAYKNEFMQNAEEEDVKNFADIEHTRYGKRLDGIVEGKFNELWEATPDEAKSDLFTLITSFKPKSDLTGLSDEFDDALKQHKFLAKVNGKLNEYQSRNITETRRDELEKEFVEMYNEEIDEAYLDTPEKEKENKKLAKAMKTWAKKSPKMLVSRLIEKREKAHDKFNELIRLKAEEDNDNDKDEDNDEDKEKPANFREYMRTVLDTEGQRSLYGSAIYYYNHTKKEKALKEASDYKMAG